ncbi:MAG: hypothetical protein QOH96_2956, partial [Blastocatellia bacterium]|nr:hypothetical protein [Blastocatellia bacterium]
TGAGVSNSGDFNTFVGNSAGNSNTTGGANAFFGNTAGFKNTTGTSNSFFGAGAGVNNINGSSSAYFGTLAGFNSTASSNSFFGALAGQNNTTGSSNAFFGSSTGLNNISGHDNSFFGSLAGRNNLASNNTFFGSFTGFNNSTGTGNSFFGVNAATLNTVGSDNTIVGASANVGAGNLANANAFGAKAFVSTSNSIVLGSINGVNGALSNTNVGIGTSSPAARLHVVGTSWFQGDTTPLPASAGKGVIIGFSGEQGYISGFDYGTFTPRNLLLNLGGGNVGIGTSTPNSRLTVAGLIETTTGGVKFPDGSIQTTAGGGGGGGILNQTSLQTGANFNIDGVGAANIFSAEQFNLGLNRIIGGTTDSSGLLIGIAAGGLNNGGIGFGTTFVGTFAGESNINGGGNSFFGHSAGRRNTGGSNNSFFGTLAGRENTTGSGNAFFGFQAGVANTGGQYNSFIGVSSGILNDNGADNTFAGAGTGQANTTGNDNSFFGSRAGAFNTSSYNSFFGKTAGLQTTSGGGNVFVGWQAGFENVTGSNNTVLGSNAGPAIGSNNLSDATAIGANALVTQSNSLVLGSVNGVNGGVDTKVGIGTTAPKAKLDVTGGNIFVGTPGQGIILKSPNGGTCRLLSIDNAGNLVTAVTPCL